MPKEVKMQLDPAPKTDEKYWTSIWEANALPEVFNPKDKGLNNYINYSFHCFFQKLFGDVSTQGKHMLELGCARSQFLPYFAKQYKLTVTGLDYSEVGCNQTIQILKRERVEGEIIIGDVFNLPQSLLNSQDYAFSYGLIEHFEKTEEALAACAKSLKKKGLLITVIPNLSGLLGVFQKYLDRDIYNLHIPLTREQFFLAHEKAGLKILSCEYFMFVNNNIITTRKIRSAFWFKLFRRFLSITSKPFWLFERMGIQFPSNRWTSPYIIAVARKEN